MCVFVCLFVCLFRIYDAVHLVFLPRISMLLEMLTSGLALFLLPVLHSKLAHNGFQWLYQHDKSLPIE